MNNFNTSWQENSFNTSFSLYLSLIPHSPTLSCSVREESSRCVLCLVVGLHIASCNNCHSLGTNETDWFWTVRGKKYTCKSVNSSLKAVLIDHFTSTCITFIIFRLFNYFWIHMLLIILFVWCIFLLYHAICHICATTALTCSSALT